MKSIARISGLALAVFLLLNTMALAQAPAPDGLTGFKTKADLDALVAKYMSGELKQGQFLFSRAHGVYRVGINKVSDKRPAEQHMDKDEFFVVLAGSATMTVGGELADAKPKSLDPTEVHGTGINGGKTQKVSAGDIISVPHGTPHLMDATSSQMVYLDLIMFVQQVAPAKKLTADDLPEPARTKVLAFKGAKIESIKQTAAGFNVDLDVEGKSKEYLFNPAGKVLALEDEVEMSSLPPAVQKGLKEAAGKGKITKVEAVDLLDLPRYFTATVLLDGKTTEVRVALDGGPVKRGGQN